MLTLISTRQCPLALEWLHWPTNLDSFCTNPEILGEKAANLVGREGEGRVGGEFGLGLPCSSCLSGEYRLLAKGCGLFVPKWVWLGIS